MLKIGLTGGIASGKSTVSKLFVQHGVSLLDADLIARELVRIGSPTLTTLVSLFGNNILTSEGALNRKKLRSIIFNDAHAKQQLESILHPKIRQLLSLRSHALSGPYCILVIPLLIETNMVDLVDLILVVETNKNNQQQRLQQRDDISYSLAKTMITSQSNPAIRQQYADNIITNNGNLNQLNTTVKTLHDHYLKQAKLHSCANSSKLP